MHLLIRVASLLVLFAVTCVRQGSADGSKTLLAQQGHRPFLEAGFGRDIAGIDRLNTFYVYVKSGETIQLGSSALGISKGDILFVGPEGYASSCLALANGLNGQKWGRIESIDQEMEGPYPEKGGFIPCEIQIEDGQEGIWKIVFLGPEPESWKFSSPITTQASWVQEVDVYTIAAWHISVQSMAGEQEGRVFAEHLPLNMGSNSAHLFSNVYILTNDGYQYRIAWNDLQSHTFTFFANRDGFQHAIEDRAIYQSIRLDVANTANKGLPTDIALQGPSVGLDRDGSIHKIFLSPPSPDLPSHVAFDGGSVHLGSSPVLPDTPSGFGYTGSLGKTGSFTFYTPNATRYQIIIDLNRNGVWGDGNDALLNGDAEPGTNFVSWDGMDSNGHLVAGAEGGYKARLVFVRGEVHFPFLDVEQNAYGLQVERLNGPGAPEYTIYFDDSNLVEDANGTHARKVAGGMDSRDGAHVFTGGFGDGAGIDTWTYYASEPVFLEEPLFDIESDVRISMSGSTTTPQISESFTVTVSIKNDGPDATSSVRIKLFIPEGLSFQSSSSTSGLFDFSTSIWEIPSLPDGIEELLHVEFNSADKGVYRVAAEVVDFQGRDPDSSPKNLDSAFPDQHLEDDGDYLYLYVNPEPVIGVAKRLVSQSGDVSGFDTKVEVLVENLGNTPLEEVQVVDLLPDALQGTDYEVLDIQAVSPLHVNSNFDGKNDTQLLVPGRTRLEVGDQGLITYTLQIIPVTSFGPYHSSAQALALGTSNVMVTDVSDEGFVTDSNDNGMPDDPGENDATIIRIEQSPALGLSLAIENLSGKSSSFSVTCTLIVENFGDVLFENLQVNQALASFFGENRYDIANLSAGESLTLNPDFDGNQTIELLDAEQSSLAAGQQASITFDLNAYPLGESDRYTIQAFAQAETPTGIVVRDVSDAGKHPDSNGNGIASDYGESDPTTIIFTEVPVIGVALDAGRITGDLGGFTVYYDLRIKNLGSTPLYEIKAWEDLEDTFEGTQFTVLDISALFGAEVNPNFDGVTNKNLISGQDVPLLPGQTFLISYVVDVQPGSAFGPFENSVVVEAQTSEGMVASDLSDSGKEIDPDGDGDANEPEENNLHVIRFAPNAALGAALAIEHVEGDLDEFDVTYTVVLENMSDVPLTELSIRQNLDSTFAEAHIEILKITSESPLVINPLFDGILHTELLDSDSGTLGINEEVTLTVEVRVNPIKNFGPYYIGVLSSGYTPFQTQVTDISTAGHNPDPDGDGAANEIDENQPVVLILDEQPVIGAAMDVIVIDGNLKGFLARHILRLENLGSVPIHDVQVDLDITNIYKGAETKVVRHSARGQVKANEKYDGQFDIKLLESTPDELASKDTARIEVDVWVEPLSDFGPFVGNALASAIGPNGTDTYDISDVGETVDINNNGLANEEAENRPVSVVPVMNPSIGIAKQLTHIKEETDGEYEIRFDIIVRNLGDVPLTDLHIIEDFKESFGDSEVHVRSVELLEGSLFSINEGFDGIIDTDVLSSNEAMLEPGGLMAIIIIARVVPIEQVAVIESRTFITAKDPGGDLVQDWSTDGINPDPNGNENASEQGEDIPTLIAFDYKSELDLNSWISEIVGDSSSYEVSIEAALVNRGKSALEEIQLSLDLNEIFPGAEVTVTDLRTAFSSSVELHPDYDGKTVTSLFDASESYLHAGEIVYPSIIMKVSGANASAHHNLILDARAVSPDGKVLEKRSQPLPVNLKTSTGEDAGLESNGDLASLLAERSYRRKNNMKELQVDKFSSALSLRTFGLNSVQGTGSLRMMDVFDLIPSSGPEGSEATVRTPEDLLGVTNATSVLAVDYMVTAHRVAGLFATTSPAGETYEHTKNVCDRLRGSELLAVDLVSVHGYPFVMTALAHSSGEVDYAIGFISYNNGSSNLIDSRFTRDQYDMNFLSAGEVLNFQVWSYNPAHTKALVEDIIEEMSKAGRVDFVSREDHVPPVPSTYVSYASYEEGMLELEVKNVPGVTQYRFTGESSQKEGGEKNTVEYVASIPADQREQEIISVKIESGPMFDALLHVTNDLNNDIDQIYVADGAWGKVVGENEKNAVDLFDILVQREYERTDDRLVVERGVHFKGNIMDSVILFRQFRPGGIAVDLSSYSYVSFVASGKGRARIYLESDKGGGTSFEKELELTQAPQTFAIPFGEFYSTDGSNAFDGEVATAVSFVMTPVSETNTDIELLVEDIIFGRGQPVSQESDDGLPIEYSLAQNYPNPFNPETSIGFSLPESAEVKMVLYDVLGRNIFTLIDQKYPPGKHTIQVNADRLASGMYIYRMVANDRVFTKTMHVVK